jgi:predicted metalloprotease with PDZ domain
LPAGWQSIALAAQGADGLYELAQAESGVIIVGPELRRRQGRAGALAYTLATAGDWAFTDEDAAHIVQEILQEHARATGAVPRKDALVMVMPFPRPVAPHVWSAETRGGTVLMLTGRAPAKTAALAQLSMPLAHELFHLWVPNGLALTGDYDWFFEGFTLYESVRAGVRLGYLSFQNYLDNLARAFDRTGSAREAASLSLLDASRRRWSDPDASVYDRGMLVAYLYDLDVRRQTNGKRSIDDLYRALFRQSRTPVAGRDGNETVIELMNAAAGGQTLTERFIKGNGAVDLAAALAPYGLQVAPIGARTRVFVAPQLSHAQRELLKQIGYNETAKRGHAK